MTSEQRQFSLDVRDLVRRFQQKAAQYKGFAYDEAALRNDFLNPFWRLLGWDLENALQKPQALRDVQIETRVEIEGRKKRADYVFRADGIPQFVCEAKKPSEPLNSVFAFQAQRYARNLNVWLAILTNFDQFQVFIVGGKPDLNNPFKPYFSMERH